MTEQDFHKRLLWAALPVFGAVLGTFLNALVLKPHQETIEYVRGGCGTFALLVLTSHGLNRGFRASWSKVANFCVAILWWFVPVVTTFFYLGLMRWLEETDIFRTSEPLLNASLYFSIGAFFWIERFFPEWFEP